jgi:putative N-acetylmannosamine-6-phosphate epimerase
VPIIAEGRFDTPDLVAEAFRRGAHAVVVGTAITNPREITRKFIRAISF